MRLSKLFLSSYVVSHTKDFSITVNVIVEFLLSDYEKCHVNLFYNCTDLFESQAH